MERMTNPIGNLKASMPLNGPNMEGPNPGGDDTSQNAAPRKEAKTGMSMAVIM